MHNSRLPAPAWLRLAAAAAILTLGTTACRDTLRVAGPSPATAESRADQLFAAFATRFDSPLLSPRYDVARVKLAGSALVPSRIFDDTTIWLSRPSPTLRLVYVSGTHANGRYHLDERASLTPPEAPGDTRHTIALQQLAPSVYRWDTNVDLAVGTIGAQDMSVLISTLLRSAEGRSEAELRENYRVAFPHAAAAFGRGFAIDSIRILPGPLGTTSVAVTASFRPELMRAAYPELAGYLDKYLGPAKYTLNLADRTGAPLFEAVGRDRQLTIRYRVQNGSLVTLFGPARPWADSLVLTADVSLKVRMFTVGFHHLVTDFVIANTGHDRSWTVVAQHEPQWDLPLITERLIRTPLRRPFEGEGSLFRLSIRDSAGTQSVFGRRTRLDVQESPIMRFIGSLASHAVGDLDTRVETEEDAFLRDGFLALQADVRGLGGAWRAGTGAESPAR
ncbi:MAG TPA: hypothetical protein VHB25_11765 [Gemmatimonadaceae bacterium]|nr:hypothetical protein [Gemmatimonadaceae bacterium]